MTDTPDHLTAVARVRPIPENLPKREPSALSKGDEALKKGDAAQALLFYDEAVSQTLNDPIAKRKMALALEDLGKKSEALDLLNEDFEAGVKQGFEAPLLAKIAKLTSETKGEKALEKVIQRAMQMTARLESEERTRKGENYHRSLTYHEKEALKLSRRAQAWIAIGRAFNEIGDVAGIDFAYERAMKECSFAPQNSLLFVRFALTHGDYETAKKRVDAIRATDEEMDDIMTRSDAAVVYSVMKNSTPEQRKEYLAEGLKNRAAKRMAYKIAAGI